MVIIVFTFIGVFLTYDSNLVLVFILFFLYFHFCLLENILRDIKIRKKVNKIMEEKD